MRVLSLTRYARLGASSRLRSIQYHPALRAAGYEITHSPLFSDDYILGLQQGRRRPGTILSAYAHRIGALLGQRQDFDVLWIEKELLPWLPYAVERLVLRQGLPYVLDYDDAVFHGYDAHRSLWVRRMLGDKHRCLMRRAALVMAGNAYLADYARTAGAKRVDVVPTVVDLAHYPNVIEPRTASDEVPVVVWIGQRSTAHYLLPLVPLMQQVQAEGLARFCAIGIDAKALGLPMTSVPWSEATEVASLRAGDIGIMPLPDEPFARGKCGYKLIQYMACGLPVIASPVGVNAQIVQDGAEGFLADGVDAWYSALKDLIQDAALRRRMGEAGRRKVETDFSLQVTAPRVAALLHMAAGG